MNLSLIGAYLMLLMCLTVVCGFEPVGSTGTPSWSGFYNKKACYRNVSSGWSASYLRRNVTGFWRKFILK